MRPSLHVNPTSWTRPPPIDSPKDVTRGSDPHRADDNEQLDSAEEDELADEFEIAYARTLPQIQRRMPGRSPLRLQHTQSMLPFPRQDADGSNPAEANGDKAIPSPQSDSVVGNGEGDADRSSAQLRRPASLGGHPVASL